MKKLLSLSALIILAKDVFKRFPDENKVFATSDGNIFLEKKKNAAAAHKRAAGVSIYEITREMAEKVEESQEDPETKVNPVTPPVNPETPEGEKTEELTTTEGSEETSTGEDFDSLTVARMTDDLTQKGIEIPKKAKKADLFQLWEEHCK